MPIYEYKCQDCGSIFEHFQKISDKYEEKGYEENIKKNLATSIAQKLILRLSIAR